MLKQYKPIKKKVKIKKKPKTKHYMIKGNFIRKHILKKKA